MSTMHFMQRNLCLLGSGKKPIQGGFTPLIATRRSRKKSAAPSIQMYAFVVVVVVVVVVVHVKHFSLYPTLSPGWTWLQCSRLARQLGMFWWFPRDDACTNLGTLAWQWEIVGVVLLLLVDECNLKMVWHICSFRKRARIYRYMQ